MGKSKQDVIQQIFLTFIFDHILMPNIVTMCNLKIFQKKDKANNHRGPLP